MDIVVTHDMSDFDGFASCVAARRLYPGAVVVLGRTVSKPLREFLALHKDRFPAVRYSEIDPARVERLIVVDVRRRSRLGTFAEVLARADRGEVEVHVFDHHGATEDDLAADHEVVERVGSATTLLVEEVRRRGLEVDPVEATLYAIGIHQDTGSLVHARTTARDARLVAWLLDRGASLAMLNRYLHVPFTSAQRDVLRAVLDAIHVESIGGVDVAFALVELPRAIDGFDEVTSQALELGGHGGLFALYGLGGRRVQVVARSRRPFLDVGKVLESVGGGGHPAAGSAIVKHGDAARVRETLLGTLRADPPRPLRVCELMSSPVHTVPHDTPLARLRDSLHTWRLTGVPVTRDGEMVGIVSRSDIEKAERDGALGVPAAGRMRHRVHTIHEDATLEEALARMTEHGIGRLPVLRDGRLVGIVTRTDLLRVLYQASDPSGCRARGTRTRGRDGRIASGREAPILCSPVVVLRITNVDMRAALRRLGQLAHQRGLHIELTVVGGAVMVLRHEAREGTRDVDAVTISPDLSSLEHLVSQVATEFGWPEHWLNTRASAFAPVVAKGSKVFDDTGITVYGADDAQVFAMKLAAMRDDVDMADAVHLAKHLGLDRRDLIVPILDMYLQDPEQHRKACYNVDDLLEELET